MFESDPEMQALIANEAAKPSPERKPLWWQLVVGALMVAGAGLALGLGFALRVKLHPVIPASGLLAGGLFAMALLGHRPARYRDVETEEKLTLWVPLGPALRGLCAFGVAACIGGGVALAMAAPL